MKHLPILVAGVILLCGAIAGNAGDDPPQGLIVASIDDAVVVYSARARPAARFVSGPVGWLYPAPGGVVFAPDIVHGTTTVIDLRSLTVVKKLEGVTTPVFGPFVDRYLVVTGDSVLAVSYPDRARIFNFPLAVSSPWQVVIAGGGSSLLVLDRRPDGSGDCRLVAADLLNRKTVYVERLAQDVSRMVLSEELGLVAMSVPEAGQVQCVEPRARKILQVLPVQGVPQDLAIVGDGREIVAAVEGRSGNHYLAMFTLRLRKKKGLVVKNEKSLLLASAPRLLAADFSRRYLAVATADSRLLIVDTEHLKVLISEDMPGIPRHLIWWTATAASPHLPMWSDRSEEAAQLPEPLPGSK